MTARRRPTRRKIGRLILWLLSPVALILVLATIWFPASKLNVLPPFLRTAGFKPLRTPETRDDQWRQDLAYYAAQLPRLHRDLYHAIDRATFDGAVADLEDDIPSLTDEQIIVRFMALTAMVGDGHTTVGLNALYQPPFAFQSLPLGFQWYPSGWYVVGGLPDYRQYFGARVAAVDGTSMAEIYEGVRSLISHDNEMQLRSTAGMYLTTPDVLLGLGFVTNVQRVDLTLAPREGDEVTITVDAVDRASLTGAVTAADLLDEVPLARKNAEDWYWYTYLEDEKRIYFQYDVCGNMDDLSFSDFNDGMFAFIGDHDVEAIIVDLRYNGGGNSTVLNPFLEAVEARPALAVMALIGPRTFSSALMNAIDLDELGATLVGEPTGGRPNHYGEVRVVRLPNSRLPVYYATRYFRELEDRDPPSLEPDIAIAVTIDDQLAGRDAVLEAALDLDPGD